MNAQLTALVFILSFSFSLANASASSNDGRGVGLVLVVEKKKPTVPSDPAAAGDSLIYVDARGETLTINDGRGVGLILVGDEQGKVVHPGQPATVVRATCAEANGLVSDWRVIGSPAVYVTLDNSAACKFLFKQVAAQGVAKEI